MWPAFRNAAAATDEEEASLRGRRGEFCPQHIFPTVVNADKTTRYFFLPPYFPRARCFSFISLSLSLSFLPSIFLSLSPTNRVAWQQQSPPPRSATNAPFLNNLRLGCSRGIEIRRFRCPPKLTHHRTMNASVCVE